MKNLYVGNLPHSTIEAELRNLFEAHGAVEKVILVTDRDTGRSRGFGFVEMTNASEADKAIAALNGTDLGGRTLTVNEAKPKSERSSVVAAGVLAAEVVVGATTTVAIHDSRANRAGSFRTHCVRRRKMLASDELENLGGQEADQHLQSARRNIPATQDARQQ